MAGSFKDGRGCVTAECLGPKRVRNMGGSPCWVRSAGRFGQRPARRPNAGARLAEGQRHTLSGGCSGPRKALARPPLSEVGILRLKLLQVVKGTLIGRLVFQRLAILRGCFLRRITSEQDYPQVAVHLRKFQAI